MKKRYKALLCAAIVVWLTAIGLSLSRYVQGDAVKATDGAYQTSAQEESTGKQSAAVNATESRIKSTVNATESRIIVKAETTQAIEAAKPAGNAADTETDVTEATTQPTTVLEGKAPDSWSEATIIKKLRAAINRVETNEESFKLIEIKTIEMSITDCSDDSLFAGINNIVQGYTGEKEAVYSFEKGLATDANGISVMPKDVLPPSGDIFKLTTNNISYAVAEKEGENIRLTVRIDSETADLLTAVPLNHAAAIGYIDFSKLTLDPITLTDVKVTYSRATLSALVDSKNRLISISSEMPVQIDCSARLGKDFSAGISGMIACVWKLA